MIKRSIDGCMIERGVGFALVPSHFYTHDQRIVNHANITREASWSLRCDWLREALQAPDCAVIGWDRSRGVTQPQSGYKSECRPQQNSHTAALVGPGSTLASTTKTTRITTEDFAHKPFRLAHETDTRKLPERHWVQWILIVNLKTTRSMENHEKYERPLSGPSVLYRPRHFV